MTTSTGPRIAILDYGMGNLRSVEKALERTGATPVRTRDHEQIRSCDGSVLPGVGAFPKAMRNVRELEFDVLIGELLAAARPMLGICLGMQLLFEATTENEGGWGLGLLGGRVERLPAGPQGAAHRLERGALDAPLGAHRRTARHLAVLLRALASRRSP